MPEIERAVSLRSERLDRAGGTQPLSRSFACMFDLEPPSSRQTSGTTKTSMKPSKVPVAREKISIHWLASYAHNPEDHPYVVRMYLMTRSYSEQIVGDFVQSDHRSSLSVIGYPDRVGGVPEQRSDLACGRQLPICVQELRWRRGRR